MKLHLLTAVTRPENLSAIADSIVVAHKRAPEVDLAWHLRFDSERRHVGGQALKNAMINEILDGWIAILDDDTLMHRDFLVALLALTNERHDLSAIVVSQQRTTGQVLVAAAENVVVGAIDAGQAILKRDLIGDRRLPRSYAGDGQFLEALLPGRTDVAYLSQVLSLHNALTGIDVSDSPDRVDT